MQPNVRSSIFWIPDVPSRVFRSIAHHEADRACLDHCSRGNYHRSLEVARFTSAVEAIVFGHRYFGARMFGPRYFGPTAEIVGFAAVIEAAEMLSATVQVAVAALADITEAPDTLEATGGAPTIIGEASIQEAADTLSAAGEAAVNGAAAINEAADTLLASGAVEVAVFAEIQEQADAIASAGEAAIAAAAAIQEAGDTLESAALVDAGILGNAAIIEAAENLSAQAQAAITAFADITEAQAEILLAGTVAIVGAGAVTEQPDTMVAGFVPEGAAGAGMEHGVNIGVGIGL